MQVWWVRDAQTGVRGVARQNLRVRQRLAIISAQERNLHHSIPRLNLLARRHGHWIIRHGSLVLDANRTYTVPSRRLPHPVVGRLHVVSDDVEQAVVLEQQHFLLDVCRLITELALDAQLALACN